MGPVWCQRIHGFHNIHNHLMSAVASQADTAHSDGIRTQRWPPV